MPRFACGRVTQKLRPRQRNYLLAPDENGRHNSLSGALYNSAGRTYACGGGDVPHYFPENVQQMIFAVGEPDYRKAQLPPAPVRICRREAIR